MVVAGVREISCEPYAGGRSFGTAGSYEVRRLEICHRLDPGNPANERIVDLELAPTGADGLVTFTQDALLFRPTDAARASGVGLVDIVNRGRPTAFRFLQQDHSMAFPPPPIPEPGDGHLLEQGHTVVMAGWQHDIDHADLLGLDAPAALIGGEPPVGTVTYATQPPTAANSLRLAFPGHRPATPIGGPAQMWETGDDGLAFCEVDPGCWHFTADGQRVVRDGGFVAGRRYRIEYTTRGSAVAGCGLAALRDLGPWLRSSSSCDVTVLFGVSQCGRVIRRMLRDQLMETEDGEIAHDGLMPLIAGALFGRFNDRFASPGLLPSDDDGASGPRTYGDLAGLSRLGRCPKIMALNTSTEYWRGDAHQVHETDGDVARVHHVAGTQHSPGTVPQLFEDEYFGTKGHFGFGTIDYGLVARSLLTQLVEWCRSEGVPAPSRLPHELMSRREVLGRFAAAGWPVPVEDSFGRPAGPVPAVGDDLNELGGIRLPDVAIPLGVHTGWNIRHLDCGASGQQLALRGSSVWFEPGQLADRYGDEAGYRAAVADVVDRLVAERLLLATDREVALEAAVARWREAAGTRGPAQRDV